MKRNANRAALLLLALLLLLPTAGAPARVSAQAGDGEDEVPRGELSEIRDKRRALLVVSRSLSVDTRGPARAVMAEVFEGARPAPRHDYAYDLVSKRIEKYARQYGGLTAVESVEEADFVIVYKVVTEHRSFSPDEPFVFGEMFVFLNRTPERPQPVLLWRTKSDHAAPGDAVSDFIKSLKAVRGEK